MFNRIVFKPGNKNKLTNSKLEMLEEDDVKKILDVMRSILHFAKWSLKS